VSASSRIPVIGLVGGVGSGKSTVARWLTKRRSLAVLDGDAIGHRILTDNNIIEQLRQRFGESVLDDGHNINRTALGRKVFGKTTEEQQARHDLEQIVHPQIRSGLIHYIEIVRQSGDVEAILMDAAVLLEAGWNHLCDSIVFIETPFESRKTRVQESRFWNENEVPQREASQLSLSEKRAAAEFVVDNSTSIEQAGEELSEILDKIIQRTHQDPSTGTSSP
jgi:dephospho-CoA kinase